MCLGVNSKLEGTGPSSSSVILTWLGSELGLGLGLGPGLGLGLGLGVDLDPVVCVGRRHQRLEVVTSDEARRPVLLGLELGLGLG